MKIGSLFSGIGGLELGLEQELGATVSWQVERDETCRAVLARHWPEADRSVTDVCEAGAHNLETVDLLCGGFPCQDVSSAGRGAGLAGARSGLWREFARIVAQLRPRVVVVENVASGARRWLPHVRRDLHMLGYSTDAVQVSAFDVGAPHRRERVFVVAYALGVQLREQQGRGRGSARERQAEPTNDGAARVAPDTNGVRELQQERLIESRWRWSRHGDGWSIESPVCGVAYGVSGAVVRNRMLGNAVCPEQARAVGRLILATLEL